MKIDLSMSLTTPRKPQTHNTASWKVGENHYVGMTASYKVVIGWDAQTAQHTEHLGFIFFKLHLLTGSLLAS